tara:strand:- start:49 stop:888 length:840 start_codon:yes stop_codon:yes gene_type:complete
MPSKRKKIKEIITPGSEKPKVVENKKIKRTSKKSQESKKFKDKIYEDYKKNNVGVAGGYMDSSIKASSETRMLSEQRNGKETYLNQFYSETDSHNKDYNYLDEEINEDYNSMRSLEKNIDGRSNLKQGLVSYDKFKNLDMGSYRELGDDANEGEILFNSYNARSKGMDFENRNLKLRREGYEKLTNKDFKEIFGKSKNQDKKTFNQDLRSTKEKYSVGQFGLGGIEDGNYVLGEENAQPFLDKFKGIKTEAQNIDSRFKLSSEKFNNLTGGKKSKLKFG